MVAIKLPDGSVMNFDGAVSGKEVAEKISAGLAKNALAVKVNDKLQDLAATITTDATVTVITAKDKEGLAILRHSCSHVMAEAVKELWPDVQVTIGPAIENGFYYDFARKEPFTTEDFAKIEAKMHEIVKRDEEVSRKVLPRNEAIDYFKSIGEHYKVELIEDLPENEVISLYTQGNFTDLCRGPHVPSTGKIGDAFKLTKVAGAYWRGDSSREMLQRIYATAWANKKDLQEYLTMLEEAEKRDHRKLGREMDLFHFEPEYAPGAVFWHDKGYKIYRKLIEYMRNRQEHNGYIEISTPRVMDRVLWEISGHWDKYGAHNYSGQTEDKKWFCIKPMNCPGGLLVYKQGIKSYRDLPLRVAEFGKVNRYEASGSLMGLMRVREFTQDDAHIFMTREQMESEIQNVVRLFDEVYNVFGLKYTVELSTMPEDHIGTVEEWEANQEILKKAITGMGKDFVVNEGDGAFYGPKLDFHIEDCLGRTWQCGTIQLDSQLPERFNLEYTGEDGQKHRPVMIHRVVFGSIERFIGVITEHFAGAFPLWLTPVQVKVLPVTDRAHEYAKGLTQKLVDAGIRAEDDCRSEKLGYKIREAQMQKIPYMLVVGDRDMENGTVSVRTRKGEDLGAMTMDAFLSKCLSEIASKSKDI